MAQDRTEILEDVAAGRLSPEEAADLLGGDEGHHGAGMRSGPRTVRATLSAGGLVQVRGDDGEADVRLLGSVASGGVRTRNGSAVVHAGGGGGKGAMVVPTDCDLDVEINAAAASIVGLSGELHAMLNVGDVEIDGWFERGHSTVFANAGDIEVNLRPGSDVLVRVRGTAQARSGADLVETDDFEWTMGDGTATLDIGGNFGTVYFSTEG